MLSAAVTLFAATAAVLLLDRLLYRRSMKKRERLRRKYRQLEREYFMEIADRQATDEP